MLDVLPLPLLFVSNCTFHFPGFVVLTYALVHRVPDLLGTRVESPISSSLVRVPYARIRVRVIASRRNVQLHAKGGNEDGAQHGHIAAQEGAADALVVWSGGVVGSWVSGRGGLLVDALCDLCHVSMDVRVGRRLIDVRPTL